MLYLKPKLLGYSAIKVIKSLVKNGFNLDPGSQVLRTIPAYEADE
jgi:hypothetical protein